LLVSLTAVETSPVVENPHRHNAAGED